MQTRQQPPAFPGTERVDPARVFTGIGYNAPRLRTNRWAIAALISTILILPIVPIVCGIVAWQQLRTRYETGLSFAYFALVVGSIVTAWELFFIIVALIGA